MAQQKGTSRTRAATRRSSTADDGGVRVIVEVRVPRSRGVSAALRAAAGFESAGFGVDVTQEPVSITPTADIAASVESNHEECALVAGAMDEAAISEVEARPEVVKVWRDTPIEPIDEYDIAHGDFLQLVPSSAFGPCPIPPCDCEPAIPKGDIPEVAKYLGADQIWAQGHRGQGIAIGIVDGGIRATGRPIVQGERGRPTVSRVVTGFPNDWGTTAAAWGDHGNMSATDALGMAPSAVGYDIRIAKPGIQATISAALAGYDWAIQRHRANGTPHILSNSWGIYQKAWDPDYATNPNHPFTRKVLEAINEGIIVLFAAGNCGERCGSGRCGGDKGPGKSIWGANGHPRVMTVGAANIKEQLIGYSSQGPAALDAHKPDFCSISHFRGYFASDTGTSAACPVAAGVVALLKQAAPTLTSDRAKDILKRTVKNIGPAGWDQHSGSGIIQAKAAFDQLPAADPCRKYARYLTRVLALARSRPTLRACLSYYICRRGRRPRCLRTDLLIVRRVLAVLRRCPRYRTSFCRALPPVDRCRRYVTYLRRVLVAARSNARLRICLCYYVCRQGTRPRCSRAELAIVRQVLRGLPQCPRYRAAFCRALRCG